MSSRHALALGDCLDRVPALAQELGPFELIYVDPPFNAGGTRRARSERGDRVNGASVYSDHWGGLSQFIDMLSMRLPVLRDALAPSGSFWLHLDYRAVHDAKVAADHVFGRSAFAGEVIWVPGNGAKRRSGPSVTHQTILVYRKGREMIWNHKDPTLREPYAETSRRMHFKHRDAAGRNYRERHVGGRTYRYYADEGRSIGSVWTDCPAMNANTPLTQETTGYPTQKPESLLNRIVRAATTDRGTVLDPMCGSGTTLVSALSQGRSAGGCDISQVAVNIARKRIAKALQGLQTQGPTQRGANASAI